MKYLNTLLITTTAIAFAPASHAVTLPYNNDFSGGAGDFSPNGTGSWSVISSGGFEPSGTPVQNVYQSVLDDGSGGNTTGLAGSLVTVPELGGGTNQDFQFSSSFHIEDRGGSGASRNYEFGILALADASAQDGYLLSFDAFGPTNGNAKIYSISSGISTLESTSTGTLGVQQGDGDVYNFVVSGSYDGSGDLTLDLSVEFLDAGVSQGSILTSLNDISGPEAGTYFGLGSLATDAKGTVQSSEVSLVAIPEVSASGLLMGVGILICCIARRRR